MKHLSIKPGEKSRDKGWFWQGSHEHRKVSCPGTQRYSSPQLCVNIQLVTKKTLIYKHTHHLQAHLLKKLVDESFSPWTLIGSIFNHKSFRSLICFRLVFLLFLSFLFLFCTSCTILYRQRRKVWRAKLKKHQLWACLCGVCVPEYVVSLV